MSMDKPKDKFTKLPIEKHDTAAWSNILGAKPVSRVIIPRSKGVRSAKNWVDTNQK